MLLLFAHFGISLSFVLASIFCCVLIIITFIDLKHQIIPDLISLPGIPVFFLSSFLLPRIHPLDSLLGIIVGGGTLYLLAAGYYQLTKKEGMGGGDIKLLAMIGAFLGWKGTIIALLLGAFTGTVIGMAMILFRGKNFKYAIPFGPFLSLGALCSLLWGEQLINWYLLIGN
jgi:leader peptidase (prepilin peptidase)/N-methyltransferase